MGGAALCPASCTGASLSFWERSVAECAFLRLVGIGARAPAACRQQRGKQDEQVQRQEKASFHGLSARLNMNRVSLILYRRSRFGSRENGKKME